jgi:PTH1 family peptidyl-tRNA hydrolase
MSDRWIVFGLGNPGDQYYSTRHNAGHMVVNYLASSSKFSSHKSRCEIAEIRVAGTPVSVAKSKLYMNESGAPLKALADFYKVPPHNIIVVHDEIDIPFNTIRLKLGGGDNGHNGLKDITKHFAGPDYFRVRIGVGRPPAPQDPADYVLKPFSSTEKKELDDFIARGALAVERLIEKGLEAAQQDFNK